MPEEPSRDPPHKPPTICPACGNELSIQSKHWKRYRDAMAKTVRYPCAYIAEYHCGARITAKLHSSGGFTSSAGHTPNEEWRTTVEAGCPIALQATLHTKTGIGD